MGYCACREQRECKRWLHERMRCHSLQPQTCSCPSGFACSGALVSCRGVPGRMQPAVLPKFELRCKWRQDAMELLSDVVIKCGWWRSWAEELPAARAGGFPGRRRKLGNSSAWVDYSFKKTHIHKGSRLCNSNHNKIPTALHNYLSRSRHLPNFKSQARRCTGPRPATIY